MRFRIGDVVKISRWSEYYRDSSSNPKGVEGIIDNIWDDEYLPIKVTWENGCCNGYRESDLRLVRGRK